MITQKWKRRKKLEIKLFYSFFGFDLKENKMNKNEKELLDHGLGNVTWWGYSPAFNILEDCTETDEKGKHVV